MEQSSHGAKLHTGRRELIAVMVRRRRSFVRGTVALDYRTPRRSCEEIERDTNAERDAETFIYERREIPSKNGRSISWRRHGGRASGNAPSAPCRSMMQRPTDWAWRQRRSCRLTAGVSSSRWDGLYAATGASTDLAIRETGLNRREVYSSPRTAR